MGWTVAKTVVKLFPPENKTLQEARELGPGRRRVQGHHRLSQRRREEG